MQTASAATDRLVDDVAVDVHTGSALHVLQSVCRDGLPCGA